ncbi:hypothetical protein TNCV_921621 [Trichonephila clavipes]|nr:hypothetical protein TNCV_921621 [Trichonephila clavipes]
MRAAPALLVRFLVTSSSGKLIRASDFIPAFPNLHTSLPNGFEDELYFANKNSHYSIQQAFSEIKFVTRLLHQQCE